MLCSNSKKKFDELFANFERVTAAGGIVFSGNCVLLIFRNGLWDLPKGHVDLNEEINSAVVREVKEECGINKSIDILEPFRETYHTYLFKARSIMKTTIGICYRLPFHKN